MGILEKNMETTIIYWGYIGKIMDKNMQTTIWGLGFRVTVRLTAQDPFVAGLQNDSTMWTASSIHNSTFQE